MEWSSDVTNTSRKLSMFGITRPEGDRGECETGEMGEEKESHQTRETGEGKGDSLYQGSWGGGKVSHQTREIERERGKAIDQNWGRDKEGH